jgi:hypothetical protein
MELGIVGGEVRWLERFLFLGLLLDWCLIFRRKRLMMRLVRLIFGLVHLGYFNEFQLNLNLLDFEQDSIEVTSYLICF